MPREDAVGAAVEAVVSGILRSILRQEPLKVVGVADPGFIHPSRTRRPRPAAGKGHGPRVLICALVWQHLGARAIDKGAGARADVIHGVQGVFVVDVIVYFSEPRINLVGGNERGVNECVPQPQRIGPEVDGEQARIVCAQFKDDDVDMQTALLRLVQTRLFEILTAVNEETEIPRTKKKKGAQNVEQPIEKVAPINITALARSVSGLVRADSENRKWAEKARAAVAMATKKLEEARDKGLSKNAAAQIRSVLMEI